MEIRAIDPTTASEATLRAQYDLYAVVEAEAIPRDEPQYWPFEEWKVAVCVGPSFRHLPVWHAYGDDGRLLGFSMLLYLVEEANQNLGSFWVHVHPDARRRGVGRALWERVVETALANGRTLLDAAGRPRIAGSIEFLKALGGHHVFNGQLNVLQLGDLDHALMNEWIVRAKERAGDYDLEVLDSPVPDDRVEAMVAAQDIMNTAPREEMEAEDDVFTVERFRQWEAMLHERAAEHWILAAVHRPSGVIAGYTEVELPGHWPVRAYQGDTGVHPDHRYRGLGRWLKATMALRIANERPAVRSISTGNAGSNGPMLSINRAMGFRCVEQRDYYQVPIG